MLQGAAHAQAVPVPPGRHAALGSSLALRPAPSRPCSSTGDTSAVDHHTAPSAHPSSASPQPAVMGLSRRDEQSSCSGHCTDRPPPPSPASPRPDHAFALTLTLVLDAARRRKVSVSIIVVRNDNSPRDFPSLLLVCPKRTVAVLQRYVARVSLVLFG